MRIAAGEADLVLGCDMVVVNDYWVLSKVRGERSQVVLNTYEAMPGTFTTHPDMQFPATDIIAGVKVALGGREPMLVDMAPLCDGEVIYFAHEPALPVISEHLEQGKRAVIVR